MVPDLHPFVAKSSHLFHDVHMPLLIASVIVIAAVTYAVARRR